MDSFKLTRVILLMYKTKVSETPSGYPTHYTNKLILLPNHCAMGDSLDEWRITNCDFTSAEVISLRRKPNSLDRIRKIKLSPPMFQVVKNISLTALNIHM